MGFHNRSNSDGVGVNNSPRFSSSMTRRAPSFKRNNNNNVAGNPTGNPTAGGPTAGNIAGNNGGNSLSTHHEIDLLTSPRSETAASPLSGDGFEPMIEKKMTQNHFGLLNHRVTVNKKVVGGESNTVGAVVEMGFRERKKLGQWMFFFFCGVCLLLGVFKIFFSGLAGSTNIDSSHQTDQSDHDYGYKEGVAVREEASDLERTLMMVASGVVGNDNNMANWSDIWHRPRSENFTQCIELTKSHKLVDENTNGYILINANGGLNQMRFGSADL